MPSTSFIRVRDLDPVVAKIMRCAPAFAQLLRCPKTQTGYDTASPQRCTQGNMSLTVDSHSIVRIVGTNGA
jgi:hypothetical protein